LFPPLEFIVYHCKKLLTISRLLFLAAIGWFILSIVLLTLPGTAFPSEDWFDRIWLDKWIHVGLFGMLVLLWCLAWGTWKKPNHPKRAQKYFIAIAGVFTLYGIAMEFVQLYLVANRSFDAGDVVADAVGCAAGALISLRRYTKK
jgi:hypothetical protein